jgi:hypothetical protein
MSDFTNHLQENFRKHLNQMQFELVKLTPLPGQENDPIESGTVEYLIRIKLKQTQSSPPPQKPSPDSIFLPGGKLNIPYLLKNADLLFEAGEYVLARKIYKTILQSGGGTAAVLFRLEKCNEAESQSSSPTHGSSRLRKNG